MTLTVPRWMIWKHANGNKLMKQILWPSAVFAIISVTMPWVRGDIVLTDETIIHESLAVGTSTVNDENFGFDTLRLKQPVIRILLEDSSSSGSFPKNDWRLLFNDESATPGDNYFAIEDATAGTVPFRIDAGAPTDSFRITTTGLGIAGSVSFSELGLGTDTPEKPLHILTGSEPTIRFEQDGSAGFSPQTWDLVATDVDFFLRDITHGSNIPFRVEDNAPQNSLTIETITGDVGIGLNTPTAPLHLQRNDGNAKLLIEETSAIVASRELLELRNRGGSQIRFNNTDSGVNWLVQQGTNDVFSIGPEGDDIVVVTLDRQVGIGIDVPEETLHVRSTNGTAEVLVEETATETASRSLLRLENPGGAFLTMNNVASSNMWHVGNRDTDELVVSLDGSSGDELVVRADGQVEIGPGLSSVFVLDPAGNLTIQGTLSQGSDLARKEILETADPAETLAKVVELPIARWNFREDPVDTPHIGPMAQDFHAAFDVGHSDTAIAPLDTAGVTLAAIQGLHEIIVDKNERIESLERKVFELKEFLLEVQDHLGEEAN